MRTIDAQRSMTPAIARALPFAIYIAFLVIESAVGSAQSGFDARWLYPLKVGCVAVALLVFWKQYAELNAPPHASGVEWILAIACGVLVFVFWIFLDQPWAVIGKPGGWAPTASDGSINWILVIARLTGAAVIVPVMEELFWRSLVMRWIRNPNFLSVQPRQAGAVAIVVSSALFASEHHQWLAGLIAGFAYAGIYMRSGNLWTAVGAHALTNLLLGVWVLYTRQWQFW